MSAVVVPLPNIWGASAEDWAHFDLGLGLLDDLLPVVSNPHVEIADGSTLKSLGKVPSVYNRDRKVVGLKNWTVRCTTAAEMDGWAAERDYGICVQTRRCRAIDIDVDDPVKAQRIAAWWAKSLGSDTRRVRDGSGKCLIPVMAEGELAKIIVRVDGGSVEVLGNGQQFVAVGTHPKGARYRWEGGRLPVLDGVDELKALVAEFAAAFAVEPVIEGKLPSEREADLDGVDDPVADWLEERGLVLREEPRGLIVTCPWAHEHSNENEDAIWLPAGGRGKAEGHFRCLHAHCEHRTRADYLAAVGYVEDVASQFEDLGPVEVPGGGDESIENLVKAQAAQRFPVMSAADFLKRPHPGWLIKGVIPAADLVVVYGESGSGKSFIVTDMALSMARGVPWRGLRTKGCRVLYVVAEGGGGYGSRLQAYAQHWQVDVAALPFGIIHAAPNLTDPKDVTAVIASVKAWGGADVVVIDTFAQVTPGANENAGEDMGKALGNARAIGRAAGGTVLLVHHAGKDAARGARGWSGIKAAADAELEVAKDENGRRFVRTTKQKDGRGDGVWGFDLVDVWLGEDEDGDPVESCVVVESKVPDDMRKGRALGVKRRALGPIEAAIMAAVGEMAMGGGDVLKPEVLLRVADEMKGEKPAPDKRDRWKAKRALDGLLRQGLLGAVGEVVFEAGDV